MRERIAAELLLSASLKQRLAAEQSELIAEMALALTACLREGGTLLLAGNGGSAGDCQHLATEFVVRLTSARERRALPALALTTDSSLLTACANDYGFEQIFSRQVQAHGKPGDLLWLFSTSGNSSNLVRAAESARERGLGVVGLLGGTGGALKAHCDLALVVPESNPGRVQECHITVGHILVARIEEELFGL
ncbi:MAG: SIS domain-containing protein [Calditrichaeota bacterium]|nr:SIS domain-containing protein [Candidatus Cloacimonadota bacterium]MCB1047650.1 SIS domain-containing protein [Calditrichota bacterium]MCB9473235.1 SIS domain-containing protein [Candidatus Delongbacteria bacterium]